MPKTGMLIVNLEKLHQGAPAVVRIPDVANYGIPENGADFLAYLKVAKTDAAAAATSAPGGGDHDNNGDSNDDGIRSTRAAEDAVRAAGGRGGGVREFGATLELRESQHTARPERTLEDVAEYVFAKDGTMLLYTVSSRKERDQRHLFRGFRAQKRRPSAS